MPALGALAVLGLNAGHVLVLKKLNSILTSPSLRWLEVRDRCLSYWQCEPTRNPEPFVLAMPSTGTLSSEYATGPRARAIPERVRRLTICPADQSAERRWLLECSRQPG